MLLWNIVNEIKNGQTDTLEKIFKLQNETNQIESNLHSNIYEGDKTS